jgi:uncharacterized protein YndB with AHSA1/START domain
VTEQTGAAVPEAQREVVITRVFDAPARLLFEAYAKPEHVKRWFGPRGWPLTLVEMDFRPGGTFRFGMTGPGGTPNTPFGGTYLEIIPNRKIVYDNGFELPGAEKMVVTVTYDEEPAAPGQRPRTTMTIRTVFASLEMMREHVGGGIVEGVNSALDQLEEVVAGMQSAP